MVTPEVLRLDAAKLGALADAFERTYLHFLDIGSDEPEERNKGALAFYAMKDLVDKIVKDAEILAGNMEVCDAIYAAGLVRKGGNRNG